MGRDFGAQRPLGGGAFLYHLFFGFFRTNLAILFLIGRAYGAICGEALVGDVWESRAWLLANCWLILKW